MLFITRPSPPLFALTLYAIPFAFTDNTEDNTCHGVAGTTQAPITHL
jgi:hypothetical protein